MPIGRNIQSRGYAQIFGAVTIFTGLFLSSGTASALTADDVMNKMSADERSAYFAGMIEGFAFSRWLKERPSETGMNCIYNWYYDEGLKRSREIHQWFRRHIDKPAGPMMFVLLKRECGE